MCKYVNMMLHFVLNQSSYPHTPHLLDVHPVWVPLQVLLVLIVVPGKDEESGDKVKRLALRAAHVVHVAVQVVLTAQLPRACNQRRPILIGPGRRLPQSKDLRP